ncbi:MAG TPA: HDOD domain-containing protein [Verrucomicrobiae bacterium]|jgi:HD-like signal output (HDOD) protein
MSSSNLINKDAARGTPPEKAGSTSWRILFVEPDILWFEQVKRDMECLHPGWVCMQASPVLAGPISLEWQAADAIIVEGRAAGARPWLETVVRARPNINCLIRCDLADKPLVDEWKRLGFPMLASRGDASALCSTLLRNARLRQWMADPVIKALLPQIRKLPATPRLYTQVSEELRSHNSSLEVVAHLLRQDPVMSAKILQLVNSAFFASASEVTDMIDAATILGTERIKSLVLLAGVFFQYNEAVGVFPAIDALLAHSVQTGVYARAIVLSETKNAPLAEAAFTAGILHDMGKMILAGNLPDRYKAVRALRAARQLSDHAAEMEIFGATHAKVAACLLASWGLPLPILEAVAWHHEPECSPGKGFSLLAAIHAANAFAHESAGEPFALQQAFFDRIGLPDGCARWRQMFGLDKTVPS